jgi:alpha-tubulin suppressor-like RCC1 family protein
MEIAMKTKPFHYAVVAAMVLCMLLPIRLLSMDVVAWGGNYANELSVPSSATNVVAIYAGGFHGVALRADGTVVVWGNIPSGPGTLPGGALQPPAGLSNVVGVAAGNHFNVALKSDGRLVAWGDNRFGQFNGLSGLSNIVAVAGGDTHTLALRADGTVFRVGGNTDDQLDLPAGLNDAVAIAAANAVSLVLRSDGTVVQAGRELAPFPPEATNVRAIAAGQYHALALRADGAVIEWGYRQNDTVARPNNLGNVVAIAAGAHHDLVLRSDGSIVAWGANWAGQAMVPASLSNVVSAAAGYYYGMALVGQGTPRIIQQPMSFATFVGGNARLRVSATGSQPLHYQWRRNGVGMISPGYPVLALDRLLASDSGDYDVVVSNAFGATTSHVATVSIAPSPPMNVNIEVVPTNGIGFLGGTAAFTAYAQGTPPFSYSWSRDQQALTGAHGQVLLRDNLLFADAGNYAVVVSNSLGSLTSAPVQFSVVNVAAWGGRNVGSDSRVFDVPAGASNVVAVSASQWDVLARCKDGAAIGWGDPYGAKLPIPDEATNLAALAAGGEFSLGLRCDGTVLAWGDQGQGYGILNLPAGLTNVIQIQAAYSWALALKSDGTVIQWGTYLGESPPPGLSNVIQISAGPRHALALLEDGAIVAWGSDDCGLVHPPGNVSNVVFVVAGDCYDMALREDGTVVEWGVGMGQYSPPHEASNLVAIATGNFHRVGLRDDGKVFSWGFENGGAGQTKVPPDLPPVVAIVAAGDASFGVIPSTGEPHIARQPRRQTILRNQPLQLQATLFPGSSGVSFQWFKDGLQLPGETNSVLQRNFALMSDSGLYQVVAQNQFGADSSRRARVQVVNRSPVARASAAPLLVVAGHLIPQVISANNRDAAVMLDGSRSSDPDNDPLDDFWFEADSPAAFDHGVVVTNRLPLGVHTIVLVVSDGFATSSNVVTLEVVTAAHAIEELLLPILQSGILGRNTQHLLAILNAAVAAFERGNVNAAENKLEVFQNKVRGQISASNPAVAELLVQAAQEILDAVNAQLAK